MAKERKPKTRPLERFKILPFFLILIYILFLLGRTVWQNYGINQGIINLEKEISQLREENKKLENLSEYYQSATYKEQEARLKLGYQKSGEKVFIVPEAKDTPEKQIQEKNNNESAHESNYQKWWNLFFK